MEIDKKRIALGALVLGIPVKFGDYTYRLFKGGDTVDFPSSSGQVPDGEYFLAIKMASPEGVYVGADLTLASFLKLADGISEEDAVFLASSAALSQPRKVRR